MNETLQVTSQLSGLASVIGTISIAAAIAMLGGLAAGLGQGFAAGKAVEAVSRQPEAANDIRNTMIIGQAITETTGIFALLISILIIFVIASPVVSSFLALLK